MISIDVDVLLDFIEAKKLELKTKRKKRIKRLTEMCSKERAFEDTQVLILEDKIDALKWLETEIDKFAKRFEP